MADIAPSTPSEGAPGVDSTESVAGTPSAPPPAPAPDYAALQARVVQAEQAAQAAQQRTEGLQQYLIQMTSAMQEPTPDPAEQDAQFREMFEKNPKAALQAAAEERLRPMLNQIEAGNLELAAERERVTAEERFAKHDNALRREAWSLYANEVRDFMAAMPIDVRAKPRVWDSALEQIMTKHIDEVVERQTGARIAHERGASLDGGAAARTVAAASAVLSPEEKRMAAAFDMTEDEYKKHKAEVRRSEAA